MKHDCLLVKLAFLDHGLIYKGNDWTGNNPIAVGLVHTLENRLSFHVTSSRYETLFSTIRPVLTDRASWKTIEA